MAYTFTKTKIPTDYTPRGRGAKNQFKDVVADSIKDGVALSFEVESDTPAGLKGKLLRVTQQVRNGLTAEQKKTHVVRVMVDKGDDAEARKNATFATVTFWVEALDK